ncbi:MAG TPA: 16S rRNA (uracil(1498)-N(3))-methyltransferase [Pseudolabrys sp.]|nr:16S rRNA (uracil(1498)-N(3))-methyltransferase [Pseudolabrys sp.]
MPRYEFRMPRLFVDAPLTPGGQVSLDRSQANYLLNVLRLGQGDPVLMFNGRDGEWRGNLSGTGKRGAAIRLETCLRPQPRPGDLHFLFAPLKHTRLDYVVQKAVEMGAAHLQPVMTRHTQVARVNLDRMRANAIEAAEQCGILHVPTVGAVVELAAAVSNADRLLVFCDESAEVADPLAALTAARSRRFPVSVLIGPEGGFADEERSMLAKLPNVVRIALGPRILRADTAAVAALALVQAVLGDWSSAE